MVKFCHWGWEEWAAGGHSFGLKFQSPIKPLRMDGFFSAGAPITPLTDRFQRQALAVMTCGPVVFAASNYPAPGEIEATRYTNTPALNHSVSRHLWAINIKQTNNEQSVHVPISHVFPAECPKTTELLMFVANVGWTWKLGAVQAFPEGNHALPLSLEMHVVIQYEQA